MRATPTIFAFCLATLCASHAHGVLLSADGTGQVLLYPYYTANNDNQTLISVVNSTALPKALKVRFRESRNGRVALNFNLYLGAFDVWTGGVFAATSDGNAPALLTSFDSSCTVPAVRTQFGGTGTAPFVAFTNAGYTGANNDVDINTLDRTREGFVEIIEMGEINPISATALALPDNCDAIRLSFNLNGSYGNTLLGTSSADFSPPRGGIYGSGAIVNTALGTYIDYNPTALEGFRSAALHTDSSSAEPNLSNADPISVVLEQARVVQSSWGNEMVGTSQSSGQRIDAVSSVLMTSSIFNEFSTETALAAASEWVVTMPTKSFYTDFTSNTATAIAPFTVAFNRIGSPPDQSNNACEPILPIIYDRAQKLLQPDVFFSPPPPASLQNSPYLCSNVSVIAFNQQSSDTYMLANSPSKILGAKNAQSFSTFSAPGRLNQSGMVTLSMRSRSRTWMSPAPAESFDRFLRPSTNARPHRFVGLPVIGFWALSIENNNARPGVQGFYGGAFDHKRLRLCVSGVNLNEACE